MLGVIQEPVLEGLYEEADVVFAAVLQFHILLAIVGEVEAERIQVIRALFDHLRREGGDVAALVLHHVEDELVLAEARDFIPDAHAVDEGECAPVRGQLINPRTGEAAVNPQAVRELLVQL